MQHRSLSIADLLVLEPVRHTDARGFFMEAWNHRTFCDLVGREVSFVQDNHSQSLAGVVRGLHYQLDPLAQGKLVRVVRGAVWDVAVDLRRSSSTFGRWEGVELSEENQAQIWIPPGFAHGFVALSAVADLLYKVTEYHAPEFDRCIRWDDPDLAIDWPLDGEPLLSAKDGSAPVFKDAATFG